jgi:hypothetical protein
MYRFLPHLPRYITLPLQGASHIPLNFASDRLFLLFYISQRGLEGNTVRGREWEAWSAGVLIGETYFRGRIITVRLPRGP